MIFRDWNIGCEKDMGTERVTPNKSPQSDGFAAAGLKR
jgi:hypothetical protein